MEKSLTPVPVVSTPRTMGFPDAIKQITSGKKVARISWGNEDYGHLKNEWLTIFTKGKDHTWEVSQGDLDGQDWIVLPEKKN